MSSSLLSSLKSKLQEVAKDVESNVDSEDEGGNGSQDCDQASEEFTGNTTSWLARINEHGNQPEAWLEYISMVRDNVKFPNDVEKAKALTAVYRRSIKAIPKEDNRDNPFYAALLLGQAEHFSQYHNEEAANHYNQARYAAKNFAIVHIAAAQFELDQGNKIKTMKILEQAKKAKAEPIDMISSAFKKVVHNEAQLLSAEERLRWISSWKNHQNINAPTVNDSTPIANKENQHNQPKSELLKPRHSWIPSEGVNSNSKPPLKTPLMTGQTCKAGSGEKPACRTYTDHVPAKVPHHMFDSGSEDSASHGFLRSASKPTFPRDLHRSSTDEDTTCGVPGENNRSMFPKSCLRSYSSTPDCKNPSLISAAGRSTSKDSARKLRNMPRAPPMRVKRCSLPQLHEGQEDKGDDDIGVAPLKNDEMEYKDHNKEPTSTVDLLRSNTTNNSQQQPAVVLSQAMEVDEPITWSKDRDGPRKMSTSSDSGILTQPLETHMDMSQDNNLMLSQGSCNSTLQANTPSTQPMITNADGSNKTPVNQPPTVGAAGLQVCANAGSTLAVTPVVSAPTPQPVLAPPRPPATPGMMPQYHGMMPQYPGMMMLPHMAMQTPNIITVKGKSYTIIRMIGKGGSGKVYECSTMDDYMIVAIKCVTLENVDSTTINSYKNEIELLKRLQYSHRVIKLMDYEHNQDTNMLYVVMERGDTDLATFFRQRNKRGDMSPQLLSFYWMEMLKAVQVLHKEGIVHSDLKPANFLLVAGNLKLIDFGIANAIQQDMTSVTLDQQVGTLNYMSPETIRDTCSGDGNRGRPTIKIGVKSDVWSLGCILYNLVYGKTPFQHINNQIVKLKAIMDDNIEISFAAIDNPDLLDTLKKCLVRDPRKRLTIEELLTHPYVKKG